MRYRRCALALLVAFIVSAGVAEVAAAHAELDRADPAPGSDLGQAPGELHLHFSEPPAPAFSRVQVFDDKRQRIDAGNSHVPDDSPSEIVVSLPAEVPDGVYTVAWRTVSAVDGHEASGAYPLMVGPLSAADMAMPLPVAESEASFSVAGAVARWWFTLAISLVFGTLVTWQVVFKGALAQSPPTVVAVAAVRARRLAFGAAVLLAVSTLFGAVAQAASAADVPVWQAPGGPLLELLTQGRYAGLWWTRFAFVGIVLVLAKQRGVGGLPAGVALVATALALLTSSLDSHAAAIPTGAYLAVAADWLHFMSVSVWFGGLACLAYVLPAAISNTDNRGRLLAASVRRFSRVAILSVGVIVVTGVFEAWLEVGSWDGLLQTAYGLSISAKIALLAATLLFGGFNLLVSRPSLARVAANQSIAAGVVARRFFIAVRAELALISLILVAAAILTGLSPAREQLSRATANNAQSAGFNRRVNVAGADVAIQIAPAGVGPNRFAVTLPHDLADGPVERVQLTLSFQATDLGSQPLLLERSSAHPDTWEASSPLLSQPGPWEAQLLVRETDRDDLRTTVAFNVSDAPEGVQAMASMPAGVPMSGMAMDSGADTYPVLPPVSVTLTYTVVLTMLIGAFSVLVRLAQRRLNRDYVAERVDRNSTVQDPW